MKKLKRFVTGVINWFRVKWQNGQLKKENEELKQQIEQLQDENETLEQMLDKNLNIKKIKRLENRNNELIAQKRTLLNENKELNKQIKEYKELYQIED